MTEDELIALFEATAEGATKKSGKSESESYQYRTFDACRASNRGNVVGRIVPDKNGRIFDFINQGYELKIPFEEVNEETGEIEQTRRIVRWVATDNYKCMITPEQAELNDKLKALMDDIQQRDDDETVGLGEVWKTWYTKLNLLFMKIFKFIPDADEPKAAEVGRKDYSDPNVTVVYHKGTAFPIGISSAFRAKNEALETKSWLPKAFNRSLEPNSSDYIVSIDTKFRKPSYSCQVSIDNAKPSTLTEEDLEKADDLQKEFVDRTEFKEDMVRENIELCERYIKNLEGGIAANTTIAEKAGDPDKGAIA